MDDVKQRSKLPVFPRVLPEEKLLNHKIAKEITLLTNPKSSIGVYQVIGKLQVVAENYSDKSTSFLNINNFSIKFLVVASSLFQPNNIHAQKTTIKKILYNLILKPAVVIKYSDSYTKAIVS